MITIFSHETVSYLDGLFQEIQQRLHEPFTQQSFLLLLSDCTSHSHGNRSIHPYSFHTQHTRGNELTIQIVINLIFGLTIRFDFSYLKIPPTHTNSL